MTIAVYRFGNFIYYNVKIPIIRQLLLALYMILDNLIVKIICGSEFPARCKIGKKLDLPHGANGIIIHGNVKIGDNAIIFHQVTIGESNTPEGVPTIGNNVKIGAGAKVLGIITIGDAVKIGANAVVLKNIPTGCTAVGIPAEIKNRKVLDH
jgi:serine O-acetyltransferase